MFVGAPCAKLQPKEYNPPNLYFDLGLFAFGHFSQQVTQGLLVVEFGLQSDPPA